MTERAGRHRRRRRWPVVVPVVLVLLAVAYLAVTALLARSHLERARARLQLVRAEVTAGQTAAARRDLAAAGRDAADADSLTGGPVWAGAAVLPWVGDPLDAVRTIAASAHQLTARVLPDLVTTAATLEPERLRAGPDALDLRPLAAAAPSLTSADAATRQVEERLRTSSGGWLPPVGSARAKFLRLVGQLRRTLDDARAAAAVMPSMLGSDGPRSYLMVFENDAEARGLGGLPGAYTILTADHGRIRFGGFANDTSIAGPVAVDLGRDFGARYTQYGVQNLFVNSDMSPHFPYAAQIWLAMYAKKTGRHLDGAIATDPSALSYLLRVAGPVTLADKTVVTADNVVDLTESAAYARFSNVMQRKAFFLLVARAAADHVLHATPGRTRSLADALVRSVDERRLLVWSAHPAEQAQIEGLQIAGAIPNDAAPFTAVAVNNAAGTKLDYYLDRSISWLAGPCSDSRRHVTVKVTVRNGAPTNGLPAYVVVRPDHPRGNVPVGSEHLLVSVYGTRGAALTSITIDGKPAGATPETERGHPVFTYELELPPGGSATTVLELDEPRASGVVRALTLPMVRPLRQRLTQGC
jgi:hypothetical protein